MWYSSSLISTPQSGNETTTVVVDVPMCSYRIFFILLLPKFIPSTIPSGLALTLAPPLHNFHCLHFLSSQIVVHDAHLILPLVALLCLSVMCLMCELIIVQSVTSLVFVCGQTGCTSFRESMCGKIRRLCRLDKVSLTFPFTKIESFLGGSALYGCC